MGINLAALFLMNCYSADQIDGIEDCLHKVIIRVFAHGDTVLGTVGCTRCGGCLRLLFGVGPFNGSFPPSNFLPDLVTLPARFSKRIARIALSRALPSSTALFGLKSHSSSTVSTPNLTTSPFSA